jgi:hypothetical protein
MFYYYWCNCDRIEFNWNYNRVKMFHCEIQSVKCKKTVSKFLSTKCCNPISRLVLLTKKISLNKVQSDQTVHVKCNPILRLRDLHVYSQYKICTVWSKTSVWMIESSGCMVYIINVSFNKSLFDQGVWSEPYFKADLGPIEVTSVNDYCTLVKDKVYVNVLRPWLKFLCQSLITKRVIIFHQRNFENGLNIKQVQRWPTQGPSI